MGPGDRHTKRLRHEAKETIREIISSVTEEDFITEGDFPLAILDQLTPDISEVEKQLIAKAIIYLTDEAAADMLGCDNIITEVIPLHEFLARNASFLSKTYSRKSFPLKLPKILR